MDLIQENMVKEFQRLQHLDDTLKEIKIRYSKKFKQKKERELHIIKLILCLLETDFYSETVLDDSIQLAKAIVSFQKRHKMTETGKLSELLNRMIMRDIVETKRKLSNSISRLKAVKLKNEGLVLINIPDFSMKYFDSTATLMLDCPVIVGKPSWPTKPLYSSLENVVFCPYWNVPNSILVKEIMPLVRKNPKYLSGNRMEWVGERLRQKPGYGNALGLVKFNFSNPYHIYLHDTPNKSYFKKQKRAFSHGCIRLSCVDQLAMHLLNKNQEWIDVQKSDCDKGNEKRVNVSVKTQILVIYITAWVDDWGVVQVRDDMYGWDK